MYIYMFSKLKCFHGFKSITHTFECKKDSFPSVGRRHKKERPKPLFMYYQYVDLPGKVCFNQCMQLFYREVGSTCFFNLCIRCFVF